LPYLCARFGREALQEIADLRGVIKGMVLLGRCWCCVKKKFGCGLVRRGKRFYLCSPLNEAAKKNDIRTVSAGIYKEFIDRWKAKGFVV
jgi:hypothetical protein